MKLYSYWRSSASYRVRIVLAYKGLAYQYEAVDIGRRVEQDTPEMKAKSPMRQVPVLELEDGGRRVLLTQSVAIAEYLEVRHPEPPLLPKDEVARAHVREAVEVVNAGIQPLQNIRQLAQIRKLAGDAAAAEWGKDAIAHGLTALEQFAQQNGGRYSVGDAITLADVFLVPQMVNAARFGVELTAYPRIVEIAKRAGEHPAFVAAEPKRQPDAPGETT